MRGDRARNRNLGVILCTVLMLVASVALPMRTPSAAPANSVILTATQDSYTDLNMPTTSFNGGLLNVANSFGPPGGADVTTKYVFVEFDLSGVSFEIAKATLSLATLACGGLVAVDDVDVAVYGADNSASWSEETLTWNTQPDLATGALITLDAGAITANRSQVYTWTAGGNGALATWLETQRGANDSSATLALAIRNSQGPGMADVFFEDSEETGANYGCSDSLGVPTLEVSKGGATIYLPMITG